MQVVVNGLLANYQQTGKGKTLLVLHGWGDSAKGLTPFIHELSKNYLVTALDLPGFGGSETPQQTWGLTDYAEFVQAFVGKIKLQPDVLVGHSNGGAIAIRALTNGLSASQLVLVASAGIRGEYKGRLKALRLVTKAGKLATSPLPKRIKHALRRKVYKTVGSDMLVAEHLQETFKKVVQDDVREEASRITLPTLLIYGDHDASTPLRYGEILHQAIQGSRLQVITGADHWLPTENTQEVCNIITEFTK